MNTQKSEGIWIKVLLIQCIGKIRTEGFSALFSLSIFSHRLDHLLIRLRILLRS